LLLLILDRALDRLKAELHLAQIGKFDFARIIALSNTRRQFRSQAPADRRANDRESSSSSQRDRRPSFHSSRQRLALTQRWRWINRGFLRR
jgi:hypothetical protein